MTGLEDLEQTESEERGLIRPNFHDRPVRFPRQRAMRVFPGAKFA